MKRLTILLSAIVLTTGMTIAQSNTATSTQYGNSNSSTISQSGAGANEASTIQGSYGSSSVVEVEITQIGFKNDVTTSQNGWGSDYNSFQVNQNGEFNWLEATANNGAIGIFNQIGDENWGMVKQYSGGNYANIYQEGVENYTKIETKSSSSSASVQQYSDGNDANIYQQGGADNSANVDQHGNDNNVGNLADGDLWLATDGIIQTGSGNSASAYQQGDGNDASIAQEGDDNKAFLNQYGTDNEYYVDQFGDRNKVKRFGDQGSRDPSVKGFIDIDQDGNDNVVHDVDQTGYGNSIEITQNGNGNFADVEEQDSRTYAVGNTVEVDQQGNGNAVGTGTGTGAYQAGGNNLINIDQENGARAGTQTVQTMLGLPTQESGQGLVQINGTGNTMIIDQYGAGSEVTFVLQDGSDNMVTINQGLTSLGGMHTASVSQVGSTNTATITQN